MKKAIKRCVAIGISLVLAAGVLAGCGGKKQTAQLEANEQPLLFTYDNTDVYLNEAWLYATMQRLTYEQQYSSQYSPEELWVQQVDEETDDDGNKVPVTLEDMVKREVIEQIKMTKVMCNRADEMGVSIEEEDRTGMDGYVDAAMNNLKAFDLEAHGVTRDLVQSVYEQQLLAQKVFEKVGDGEINLTYNLLFETFETTDEGERKDFSDKKKARQKEKAEKALRELQNGADIVELAEKMNADKSSYVAISEATRSNYATEYVEAADALQKAGKDGAISPITESDFGYHILMYISPENEKYKSEEADNVVSSEQQNLFSSQYDKWTKSMEEAWDAEKDVNQEEWSKVTFLDGINAFPDNAAEDDGGSAPSDTAEPQGTEGSETQE